MAYTAVRSTDPVTRDLLEYSRLLIREALRHGGGTSGKSMIVPSVGRQPLTRPSRGTRCCQASTLVGSESGTGIYFTICREPDHSAPQCALAPIQQPLLLASNLDFPSSRPPLPANSDSPPSVIRPPRPKTLLNICASWNRGSCAFPGTCTYRHVCGNCQFGYRGIGCPTAPEGSDYHRLRSTRTSAAHDPRVFI